MKNLALSLVALPILAACGTDSAPIDDDTPPIPTPHVATYWQDVEPIFYTNCQSCHTAGGIAPFAIDDPDIAIAFAPLIKDQTAARTMPPWPPGGDTPALVHVRSLTEDQIATIASWVDGGMQLGDPASPQPHVEPELIDIGPTELGFDTGVDYVPDGTLTDDYRCFMMPLDTTATRMATGFKVTPGNRAIVHHVIIDLINGADRPALEALDAATPDRAGWPCVGGIIPQGTNARVVGAVGSWVPGVSAVAYPLGTGNAIPSGSIAVIQVHYNLLGGMAPDRTRVDVALAPAAQNASLIPLQGVGMIKPNLTIPANDGAAINTVSATVAQWRGNTPFASGHGYALGAGGHMHQIGRRVSVTRTTAAGTTDTLLDIPAWSFHWQGNYQYATPIEVANDDTLTIRCEYDNSNEHRLALGMEPNTAVTFGEGSSDEMCLASLQMVETLP